MKKKPQAEEKQNRADDDNSDERNQQQGGAKNQGGGQHGQLGVVQTPTEFAPVDLLDAFEELVLFFVHATLEPVRSQHRDQRQSQDQRPQRHNPELDVAPAQFAGKDRSQRYPDGRYEKEIAALLLEKKG